MPATPRVLRKSDVERMLAAVDGPSTSTLEEITVVRLALAPALAQVLGREPTDTWVALIDAAAEKGSWPPERIALCHLAAAPDRAADTEAVLDALWDLLRELNELRTIAPPVAQP